MINPNYTLYRLLVKYHIYDDVPELYRCYYDYLYELVVNEIFDEIKDDKIVAIRGGGFQGQKIIASLSATNLKKVKYIIDKNISTPIRNIQVICPDDDMCFDVIIVGSYLHRKEFVDYYSRKEIRVIDPFKEIIDQMYMNDESYLKKEDSEYRHITYCDINECIWGMKYLKIGTEKHRKNALKLFAYLIEIKDFYNAKKYLELCLQKYGKEYIRLNVFLSEVDKLFNNILLYIEQKESKDIIINWVDNVCADDFYKIPEASELLENSLIFDNAYTVTPWTHNVFDILLTGEYPMESGFWERKNEQYTVNNSPLIKVLEDKGYHFIYYSNPGLYSNLLPEKHIPKYLSGFDKLVFGERAMSECSTRHHWNALCDRVVHSESLCCLIHNLSETHDPYVYVGRNTEIKRFSKKRKIHMEGIRKIIEELKWYGKYENGGQPYQIYLSDHGDLWETNHSYDRKRVNVVMFIKATNVIPGRFQKFVSLVDFCKLVEMLISNVNFSANSLERRYVRIENYDMASEDAIMYFLNLWREHLAFNMNILQVKAVITDDGYVYARYANGKEVYLFNGKSIGIEQFKNIEEIRKLCSEGFIDISKDKRFVHSKKIYEYLDVIPKEKISW